MNEPVLIEHRGVIRLVSAAAAAVVDLENPALVTDADVMAADMAWIMGRTALRHRVIGADGRSVYFQFGPPRLKARLGTIDCDCGTAHLNNSGMNDWHSSIEGVVSS